ncbi:hypothetical protein A1507_22795 [Methylomonas koyamae]|uniref:Uncharacterized protein n=2 Tax=Methylomonas koyamae TaxID=702114 RepID=A0A177NRV3_9GAMM|nr:hypothetical protein A1507_22795 [Methylomonas koyamae]
MINRAYWAIFLGIPQKILGTKPIPYRLGVHIMATPVKDTPVLTGKDALRFDAWLKANEGKKINPEAKARIQAASKKFRLVNV